MPTVLATGVEVSADTLSVELADGRSIAAPLAWYPRLLHATREERASWRLIGGGRGIHWPALDEDISVANLLAGQPSMESQRSFKNRLANDRNRRNARALNRSLLLAHLHEMLWIQKFQFRYDKSAVLAN
jgi:hypothetical protein